MWKRIAAGIVGLLAIIAGVFFALAYAPLVLDDFRRHGTSADNLLVLAIVGAISIAAVVFGVRFLKFAFGSR